MRPTLSSGLPLTGSFCLSLLVQVIRTDNQQKALITTLPCHAHKISHRIRRLRITSREWRKNLWPTFHTGDSLCKGVRYEFSLTRSRRSVVTVGIASKSRQSTHHRFRDSSVESSLLSQLWKGYGLSSLTGCMRIGKSFSLKG